MSVRSSRFLETGILRMRVASVLKCIIKLRSVSDRDAMLHASICAHVGFTPPTLAKLLGSGNCKAEHLFGLIEYLCVSNHAFFLIVETYSDQDDLVRQTSDLIQRSPFRTPISVDFGHVLKTAQSA